MINFNEHSNLLHEASCHPSNHNISTPNNLVDFSSSLCSCSNEDIGKWVDKLISEDEEVGFFPSPSPSPLPSNPLVELDARQKLAEQLVKEGII